MLEFGFDFKQRVEFMRFKFAGYERETSFGLILSKFSLFYFVSNLFRHFKNSFCLNFVVLNLNFCANLAFIQAIFFTLISPKSHFTLKSKFAQKTLNLAILT